MRRCGSDPVERPPVRAPPDLATCCAPRARRTGRCRRRIGRSRPRDADALVPGLVDPRRFRNCRGEPHELQQLDLTRLVRRRARSAEGGAMHLCFHAGDELGDPRGGAARLFTLNVVHQREHVARSEVQTDCTRRYQRQDDQGGELDRIAAKQAACGRRLGRGGWRSVVDAHAFALLQDAAGAQKDGPRNVDAEGSGGSQIHHQLDLPRDFDSQASRAAPRAGYGRRSSRPGGTTRRGHSRRTSDCRRAQTAPTRIARECGDASTTRRYATRCQSRPAPET